MVAVSILIKADAQPSRVMVLVFFSFKILGITTWAPKLGTNQKRYHKFSRRGDLINNRHVHDPAPEELTYSAKLIIAPLQRI